MSLASLAACFVSVDDDYDMFSLPCFSVSGREEARMARGRDGRKQTDRYRKGRVWSRARLVPTRPLTTISSGTRTTEHPRLATSPLPSSHFLPRSHAL